MADRILHRLEGPRDRIVSGRLFTRCQRGTRFIKNRYGEIYTDDFYQLAAAVAAEGEAVTCLECLAGDEVFDEPLR